MCWIIAATPSGAEMAYETTCSAIVPGRGPDTKRIRHRAARRVTLIAFDDAAATCDGPI